jgi:hypothetical protein
MSVRALGFCANVGRVVSNSTRSGHFRSEWMRIVIFSSSGTSDDGARTEPGKHQLTARSAARRKLPTHPKY